jgi:hypothetical protein
MPIGAIIGGIGGLFGAGEQASATRDAANATAGAQRYAADLQHQQFEQIQNNMQPFMAGGTQAFNTLEGGFFGIGSGNSMGGGFDPGAEFLQPISASVGPPPSPTDPRFASLGGSTLTGAPSPTDPNLQSQFRASPGYDYLIRQMTDATQNSAAGRTGAISGNMLTSLQRNAGGIADQDWWNFYNQDVSSWSNNNQNWWNVYNGINANYGQQYQDQANRRNQIISALGGFGATGQNAAASLGGFGQAAATSMGNAAVGAANATGAGRIGAANAFSGAIPGVTNAISSLFGGNNSGSNGGAAFLTGGGNNGNIPGAYASPSDFSGGFNPGGQFAYYPGSDPSGFAAANNAGFGYA